MPKQAVQKPVDMKEVRKRGRPKTISSGTATTSFVSSARKYTNDEMKRAMHELSLKKATVYGVSRKYNIPYSSLRVKATKAGILPEFRKVAENGIGNVTENVAEPIDTKPIDSETDTETDSETDSETDTETGDKMPILTADQEEQIVQHLTAMNNAGFSLAQTQLVKCVVEYANDPKIQAPFADNAPIAQWVASFLERHPDIQQRIEQSATNPAAADQARIDQWFANLEKFCTENGCGEIFQDPKRIFNVDEMRFYLNPTNDHCVNRKDEPVQANNDSQHMTVMLGANADGKLCPPIVIPKDRRVSDAFVHSCHKVDWDIGNAEFAMRISLFSDFKLIFFFHFNSGWAKNGWVLPEQLHEYIRDTFHPYLCANAITLPVAVLFPEHFSLAISIKVHEYCKFIGVHPMCVPKELNAMDEAAYKPLRAKWPKAVQEWKTKTMSLTFQKRDFSPMLLELLNAEVTAAKLRTAFEKCGLFPLRGSQNRTTETRDAMKDDNEAPAWRDYMDKTNSLIGKEKVDAFCRFYTFNRNEPWKGDSADASLYGLWRQALDRRYEDLK